MLAGGCQRTLLYFAAVLRLPHRLVTATQRLAADRLLFRRGGLPIRVIGSKRGWLLSCVSGGGRPPTLLSPLLSAQTSSGHSWTLRWAASRITCPSMPTRVCPIPYTGHWQMNSSGPAGGSGHTHHWNS